MAKRGLVAGLGVALLAFAAAGGGLAWEKRAPRVPNDWTFTLPGGNAESGKAVFMRMECHSCHAIKIPGEKLPAGSGEIGPDLTAYSWLPKEYLAESIIKAHTVVAAPGYVVEQGQAGMGKYNHFMTIQELVDLIAFIRKGTAQ